MTTHNTRVAVLGLGGGGGRIAAVAAAQFPCPTLEVAVADTDLQALASLSGCTKIALGQEWARREGCGGDAMLGERAASASAAELRQFITGARMLLVVAGLGGGTAAGGAKIVARLARDTETTALFVVTLPFAFEGNWRCQEAEKALLPLRELADAVIAVPNDLLFTSLPADTPAAEAFRLTDSLLAQGVSGLARIISAEGLVTADFAGLRALLRNRKATCTLGVGCGTGPARWQEAVESFLKCPLIGGKDGLAHADAAVLTLLGDDKLSVGEVQTCLAAFQQYFPAHARVVVGAYAAAEMEGHLQVTALVCKYHDVETVAPEVTPADDKPETPPKVRTQPKTPASPVQGELPLQEQTLGIFSGTQPTPVAGQNLDIPTFQRRGIRLDVGD